MWYSSLKQFLCLFCLLLFARPHPVIIKQLSAKGIVNIYAGVTHCIAVASSGLAFSWGASSDGQLGHTGQLVPKKVKVITINATLKGITVNNIWLYNKWDNISICIFSCMFHYNFLCSSLTCLQSTFSLSHLLVKATCWKHFSTAPSLFLIPGLRPLFPPPESTIPKWSYMIICGVFIQQFLLHDYLSDFHPTVSITWLFEWFSSNRFYHSLTL